MPSYSEVESRQGKDEAIKAEIRAIQAQMNELLQQPGADQTQKLRELNGKITSLQQGLRH